MLKSITITVPEEIAHWARKKAAEENTSVSKLVGRMLEKQMRHTDEYWDAFERWKKLVGPVKGFDASKRLTREEAHERPRGICALETCRHESPPGATDLVLDG